MEIEFSSQVARNIFRLMLVLGLVWLGTRVSPMGANGRPILLTPRLADLNGFRQDVQRWAKDLMLIDHELGEILSDPTKNLFSQNEGIERSHARLQSMFIEIESRNIPLTLEQVHQQASHTTSVYLETANLIAGWISEPSETNYLAAVDSLRNAHNLLEKLLANPWIEDQP